MSIEALWTVAFDDITGEGLRNGGVVVFETGKILGGDSSFAYAGTYEVDRKRLSGDAEIIRHNFSPEFANAFGAPDDRLAIKLIGQISPDDDEIRGSIEAYGYGVLQVVFKRLAELP